MKLQATLDDIRGNPSLRNALGCLRVVTSLDLAIEDVRDAAIRGTDKMNPEVVGARVQLMDVAAKVMAARLVEELNRAVSHLEAVCAHE